MSEKGTQIVLLMDEETIAAYREVVSKGGSPLGDMHQGVYEAVRKSNEALGGFQGSLGFTMLGLAKTAGFSIWTSAALTGTVSLGGVVGLAGAAALAIVIVLTEAGKEKVVGVSIANNMPFDLKIVDYYFEQGQQLREISFEGESFQAEPHDKIIPTTGVRGQAYVGWMLFEKKYGTYGTMGAMKLRSHPGENDFYIGWLAPYRSDEREHWGFNNCEVAIDYNGTLEEFFKKEVMPRRNERSLTTSATKGAFRISAACSSLTEINNPKMSVLIEPSVRDPETTEVYKGPQDVKSMIPYKDGVITAFSGGGIYFSRDGNNLGSGLVYSGTQTVTAMIPYKDGVITAFSGGGIYFSKDVNPLKGKLVYSGAQTVTAMIPFRDGVITAFSGGEIYFSKDVNPLKGKLVYSGVQTVTAMIPFRDGVITAFSGGGVYFSKNVNNLGSGLVYSRAQIVTDMIPFRDGIITAFSGGGIYFSKDVNNLGSGLVYSGDQPVTAMIPYKDGVITAFSGGTISFSGDQLNIQRGRSRSSVHDPKVYTFDINLTGGQITDVYMGTQEIKSMIPYKDGVITAFSEGGIYFSKDGNNLGSGELLYSGAQTVTAMIPYKDGVITAFSGGGIYFSKDGNNLGSGGLLYTVKQKQIVTAMISFGDGIILALSGFQFRRYADEPWRWIRNIYYCADEKDIKNLGNLARLYSGEQSVTAMIPFKGGVITAFKGETRGDVYYSQDGKNLGGGKLLYTGAPIIDMIHYKTSSDERIVTITDRGDIYFDNDFYQLGMGSPIFAGRTYPIYKLMASERGIYAAFVTRRVRFFSSL